MEDEHEMDGRHDSMIAFAFGDIYSGEPILDPKIVKWFADYGEFKDEDWYSQGVKLHSCTEQEMAKFYEPDEQSAIRVQSMIELGAFQCVDFG